MDSSVTSLSDQRLLVQAEPFGFGPTAAIADFFPHLRQRFQFIGYVGEGHTLDLQKRLPYDAIHCLSTGADLGNIFAQYDLFFTALDFAMAEKALAAGLPVCIYDPLTWYWKEIPPVVRQCSLYVAQDFYGVKERIATEHHCFGSPRVVPPIIPGTLPWRGKRQIILLNLGGLSNPFWDQEHTLQYARVMVESFLRAMADHGATTVIAANAWLAGELSRFGVRNFTREEMQEVLLKSKLAFMTPGLGNIYDASRYGTPTVWLPPANDSQGQQRNLLAEHGRVDGAIDWSDFLEARIDYRADQKLVLSQIAAAACTVSSQRRVQSRLSRLMARKIKRLQTQVVSNCVALTYEFGWGGAERVAELVLEQAREKAK